MSKTLLIVESPHKAKVIGGFLPASYTVMATVGSMFDIENPTTAAGKAKFDSHGVSTTTWERNLKCTNSKQFALIKKAVQSGSYGTLVVSTDPDRAGSQIGQEVVDALAADLKKHQVKVVRATWQEVTKKAVEEGLKKAGVINQDEVAAATARQIYDRLFGFSISGNVQKTIREKSAGRVQSPALRLIVDVEKARLAFVKASYMSLTGFFLVGEKKSSLAAKLVAVGPRKVATSASFDSKGRLKEGELLLSEENIAQVEAFLQKCSYEVSSITSKPYSRRPPMPYTTSSFQQDVGTRLSLGSSQIMSVAQKLFDAGYISYMRTDSPHLGQEALQAAHSEAKALYPQGTPTAPTPYKAKGQGGHEAIRPTCDDKTGKFRRPSSLASALASVDKNALKVYTAIYNRTVASQMEAAAGFTTTVKISSEGTPEAKTALFTSAATTLTSLGWMALIKPVEDEESGAMISDKLEEGAAAALRKLERGEHSTTPPARLSEPKTVAKLEELGIGRPSTYASIVTVNQTRGYVEKKGGQLYPTWQGMKVAQYLEGKIPAFVAYEATARLEEELDKIEAGQLPMAAFLGGEWKHIQQDVVSLNENIDWEEVNELSTVALHNGYQVRVNRFGAFLEKLDEPLGEGRRPGVKLSENETVAAFDFSDPEVCRKLYEAGQKQGGDRELGVLTSGNYKGWKVTAREGKYGPFLQALEEGSREKPVNQPLPEGVELATVTLEQAAPLFEEVKLPRHLNTQYFVGIGKKGPWMGFKKTPKARKADFKSLPGDLDPRTVTLAQVKKAWAEA